MDILKFIGPALKVILCVWLIISPFLMAYIAIKGGRAGEMPAGKGISLANKLIMFSGAFSVIYITAQGFQSLLFFLPGSYREGLGYVLGLFFCGGLIHLLHNFQRGSVPAEPSRDDTPGKGSA